jgi:hypothetical protein
MRPVLTVLVLSAALRFASAEPIPPVCLSCNPSTAHIGEDNGFMLAGGGGMGGGGGGMGCGAGCRGGGMGGAGGGGMGGGRAGGGFGLGGFLGVRQANCPQHQRKTEHRRATQVSEKTESVPTECSESR